MQTLGNCSLSLRIFAAAVGHTTADFAFDPNQCAVDLSDLMYPQYLFCTARRCLAASRFRTFKQALESVMRNVDSRIHSLCLDCCVFLFYSFSTVTFATKSANCGLMHRSK